PTVDSLSPHYDSLDLRDYMYYRTRWGVSGSTDYRVNNNTSVVLRGLYSTFRNWGQKWVYTLNDGDVPGASIDWRRPDYAVGNLVASGHHLLRRCRGDHRSEPAAVQLVVLHAGTDEHARHRELPSVEVECAVGWRV